MRKDILLAYKEGKLSAHEVLAFLHELKRQPSRGPLSIGQQGLWMLQKMAPEMGAYNVPLCFRILQPVDVAKFAQACNLLLQQYPILRSVVVEEDGTPYQDIQAAQSLVVQQEDISALASEKVLAYLRAKVSLPFSLAHGPLIRVHLLSRSEQEHFVLICVHHIIFDGRSSLLLLKTLLDAYIESLQGGVPESTPLPAHYGDFVQWEQEELTGPAGEAHRSYWLRQLAGTLPTVELPTDRPRTARQSFAGKVSTRTLTHAASRRIKAFAASQRVNHSVVFLGIFKTLLYRYTGQSDIIVGMPTMSRSQERFDDLLGYFVNMLPLRSQVAGDQSFAQFLRTLQLTLIDGMDHAIYPFPAMVRDLNIPRTEGRAPVFQVLFSYQNFLQAQSLQQFRDYYKGLLTMDFVHEIHQEGEFEFELEVSEQSEQFLLHFKYNPDIFELSTLQRMIEHYVNLADEVVRNPDSLLDAYAFTTEAEQRELLVAWNATQVDYPRGQCLHDYFERRVQEMPGALALVYKNETLSYRALDERSTTLALALQARGVKPEDMLGICVERSLEMVVGILAILKAGGAYVPLDPSYTEERLAYILRDSQARLLLTQAHLEEKLSPLLPEGVEALVLDRDWSEIEDVAGTQNVLVRSVRPEHLAYVIYTSGSTGKPKGVMVSHASICNTLCYLEENYPVAQEDAYLLKTNYVFDVSLSELFGWFFGAGHLVILPPQQEKSPVVLIEYIEKHHVTHINFVPAMLGVFLHSVSTRQEFIRACSLKYIMVAGEAFPKELVQKSVALFQNARIENIYGPTESSIYAARFSCTTQPIRSINTPIGKPIANTQLYILNPLLIPVPINVAGELCIAGAGLARGYVNLPALSAEKFIDNPFRVGTKLYKTGDLARWLPDGTIEFLSRIDHQVKIRGFRIELGEIESHLLAYPPILDCTVLVREQNDNKQLIAYYSSKNAIALDTHTLRDYLRLHVPEYMLPAFFVLVESMPLTPNGKVDREALLQHKVVLTHAPTVALPRSSIEERIFQIWQDVLKIEGISTDDGFFDVGGDSILAVVVTEKIKRDLDCAINVTSLFKYSSIKELAAYVAALKQDQPVSEKAGPALAVEDTPVYDEGTSQSAELHEITYPAYYAESIAIIGISCHFPGAKNHHEFWRNLRAGKESIRTFTIEELRALAVPEEVLQNPNLIRVQATIEGKDTFDPSFFAISPRDAEFMDPQARLLLQHAWKAVEDAGYSASSIPETSVFMSASNSYYQALLPHFTAEATNVLKDTNEYVSWVLAQGGTVPTLISHKLGFKGPSFAVHSNCSSSLVGLHLAYQSLQSGEAKYALIGGSTLYPATNVGYIHETGLNFSSDGHCKAFDADADGMIGGEGVAVIVVKKALEALQDGDHIYALVRGIAINNDGADKVGFYAPSVKGQAEVIQHVLEATGIHPESISYIEAHGTGTHLGDPIEFAALKDVYEKYTTKRQFCGLGSVKTNIGHLDTAAGLAGSIKLALSLHYGEIPPSLNYQRPNPHIDLQHSPFFVVDTLRKWAETSTPPRAALSSFGLGGTNAHALFEQAPPHAVASQSNTPDDLHLYLVPLSARDPDRLHAYAQELAAFLDVSSLLDHRGHAVSAVPAVQMADLAYTLQVGRQTMRSRVIFLVRDRRELQQKLAAFLTGDATAEGCLTGETIHSKTLLNWLDKNEKLLPTWISRDEIHELVAMWLKGLEVDWSLLYPGTRPSRMSLPTYPFAEEHYWAPTAQKNMQSQVALPASTISTMPLGEPGWLMLTPRWDEQILPPTAQSVPYSRYVANSYIVFFCEPDPGMFASLQDQLKDATCISLSAPHLASAQRYELYANQMLKLLQDILNDRPKEPVLIQLVAFLHDGLVLGGGLAALLKTAQLEHQVLKGQLIEVEPGEQAEALAQKLRIERNISTAAHVRYQRGSRTVAAWQEAQGLQEEAIPWKDHGIYLITGGAGGLGLIFAREIAQRVQGPTLILSGRSALDKEQQVCFGEIEALGARVVYRQTDVSDRQAVQELLTSIQQEHGSVQGIIHSAGVLRDRFLLKKSQAELHEVLAPKVAGLVYLDEFTRHLPLDFFVLFSSGVSRFGSVGQADYATANAFLDTYASYRNRLVALKQRRGHTLAIGWPLWQAGGMRVAPDTELQMRSHGMTPLRTQTGIQAFYQGLAQRLDQVLVVAGDVRQLRAQLLPAPTQSGLEVSEPRELESIVTVDSAILKEKTLHQLKLLFAEVSRLSVDKLDTQEPLETYGIDSIMITQLNKKLATVFKELSKTLLYEYQTLDALVEYLLAEHTQTCLQWTGMQEQRSHSTAGSAAHIANSGISFSGRGATMKERAAHVAPLLPVDKTAREAIAIIGMSGRYPQAQTLDEYWENLKAGKDCITEIPEERWRADTDDFFHPDPQEAARQGKSYGKWGGFLDGFADFDPLFFNISPWEAVNTDPQERLFLQACWEVLEDAGYTREQLSSQYKRRVGVFAGITKTGFDLYGPDLWKQGELIFPHTSFSSLANRVSYLLNLQGPSIPIDTMCSASLTAIHEACEHLQRDECELALAGGVNLYLHPSSYVFLSALHMLSVDGKCKSFGAGGDGFVPGEGVGCVLLKPLSRAVADGDHIYGVIRGTSINHGGKTNGYTVPNPAAQSELIHAALERAGVDARTVSYIEAHGTGTELGDPIEITGLTQAFREDTQDTAFCAIGSVKSNIGHLEAAAGIAGVTKILLQMQHQQLVPSLHAEELNQNIPFASTPFVVQREPGEWKRPLIERDGERHEYPRIAGISSFGAGGSNAHVVIEEYIPDEQADPFPDVSPEYPALIVLSARREERLKELAQRLLTAITKRQFMDSDLPSIAYTLQVGREAMEERLALQVGSIAALTEKLQAFVAGQTTNDIYRAQVKGNKDALAVFAADVELQEAIDKWIQRGKYAKLLDLWVKGLQFDWYRLYGKSRPTRISLPPYPFAHERYWLPTPTSTVIGSTREAAAVFPSLHPLVQRNTSDLFAQRFSTTLTGQEFFLRDHRVKGQSILPGVAYLEMARAAIAQALAGEMEEASEIVLQNVVWGRLLVVGSQEVQVHIVLELQENGTISFEIMSEPEQAGEEPLMHSQGHGLLRARQAEQPRWDLEVLQTNCDARQVTASQCYELLAEAGLQYGPTHRGMEQLWLGEGQVLAKLSLPEAVEGTLPAYVLHPSLLDGALQASLGLMLEAGKLSAALPFALEKLEILGRCEARMWAWLRYSQGNQRGGSVQKLDIDLCDEQGQVRARLSGFTARVLQGEIDAPATRGTQGTLLLTPTWRRQARKKMEVSPAYTRHVVVLIGARVGLAEQLQASLTRESCISLSLSGPDSAQRYENVLSQLLELLQDILKARPKGKVLTQLVVFQPETQELFSGLAGFMRTVQLEHPAIVGQVIEIASGIQAAALIDSMQAERQATIDGHIHYQDRERTVLGWQEVPGVQEEKVPWKDGGVYLITGGAGGLGLIFAREIAQQVQRATLILCGRSALSQEKLAQLAAIEALGARVVYRQVDVSDQQAVQALLAAIQPEYGAVQGIMHCAGVLRDGFLLKKNPLELREVLAPKVAGLLYLDEAVQHLPLDFFILFSSVAARAGNVGQADYAAANGFLDAYASYRNRQVEAHHRQGRTLSINWPLWEEGGMRIDVEVANRLPQNQSISVLSTADGLRAFYHAWSSGAEHVLVLSGVLSVLKRNWLLDAVHSALPGKTPAVVSGQELSRVLERLQTIAAAVLKVEHEEVDLHTELSEYGVDQLTLTELTNQLNHEYSLALTPAAWFEYPTLQAMAAYVLDTHQGTDPAVDQPDMKLPFHVQSVAEHTVGVVSDPHQLREKVARFLKKELAAVIQLPWQRIETDVPLENYGIDSIMTMKLTAQLEQTFGSLAKTLFFEYQNIQELTTYFLDTHCERLSALLGLEEPAEIVSHAVATTPLSQKQSLLTRHNRRHVRQMPAHQERQREQTSLDIAIVGVAGRYPQARNLQEYWHNLREGKDCITEIPSERWDHSQYFDPEKNKPGKTYSKWGGFLDGVDRFDPLFFNISPREAEIMDPQERLFLECVFETLEDAGYTREALNTLQGADLAEGVGVYVGVMYEEYQLYGAQETLLGRPLALGGSFASIANRVSYFCNFRGPSVAVDTMCSSSLTAIHFACQSILRGECQAAIAGGVNVSVHPNKYLMLAQGGFASSKGRCESFGQGGDGYVPAEGVGAVLLKPLVRAQADGDHIYGVIQGSAINHGGKTNGYSVPNPTAQARVIKRALREAGVDARTISYIEAHGTGTALGDPIEIAGLSKGFEATTQERGYCAIGSAKSNIGHAESAAGIAGLTKVLLQLKHRQLVPSLHAEQLNPHIDFANTPFVVQRELGAWRRPILEHEGVRQEYPRRAGISSFGAGGSNAHVIIEEYVAEEVRQEDETSVLQGPVMIVLSARQEEQLDERVRRLLHALEEEAWTEHDLERIAYTLQVGREAMEERLALVVNSLPELKEKLQAFVSGKKTATEDVYRGQVKRNKEALDVFAADEDLQSTIEVWLAKRKYARLLDLWVKGLQFDWQRLYGESKPARISLPTYPFAHERYWLPTPMSTTIGSAREAAAVFPGLHPLIQRNTSDLFAQRFSTTLTGQEFFLRDHRVKGQSVLPGVAYLEMARAAIAQALAGEMEQASEIVLQNVVWGRPLVVGAQAVQVHIVLELQENGTISFEIMSEPEQAGEDLLMHSQGHGLLRARQAEQPHWDLEALQTNCDARQMTASQCYELLAEAGLQYGPAHRGVEQLWLGEGQVLAKLSLPEAVEGTLPAYVLHPSLLDGALQASLGLLLEAGELSVALPFALEKLEILGRCEARMWAWLRYSQGNERGGSVQKLDIDLCDEQGQVRTRLSGFTARVLQGEVDTPTTNEMQGTLLLTPTWQVQTTASTDGIEHYNEHIVLLCEPLAGFTPQLQAYLEGVHCIALQLADPDIAQRYEYIALQLQEAIQKILYARPKGRVLIQLVAFLQDEQVLFAGLAAFMKSARLEYPALVGQMIQVEAHEGPEALSLKLRTESNQASTSYIRYQHGKRTELQWQELHAEPEGDIPWKDGGIYLLTGGAGGLGLIFAREIAQRVQRPTLILTGRSALNEEKQARIHEIEALGARVVYRQIDISDRQMLKTLLAYIQQNYGNVQGIIHSAGVLRDSFLLKKSQEELHEVLTPKVAGVINLDEVTHDLPLDFFILFSSVAASVGNVGQADYAAANAFLDAYASYRNRQVEAHRRQGRTLSINWPLWQEGGMHVNVETIKLLQQEWGLGALSTQNGLRALYHAWASGHDQVQVLEGDPTRLRLKLLKHAVATELSDSRLAQTGMATEDSSAIVPVSLQETERLQEAAVHYFKKLLSPVIKLSAQRIEADAPLERYGLDSIMVMQLTTQLEKTFGSLSKTLLFEYQTIQELTGYFLDTHREQLLALLGLQKEKQLERHSDLEQHTPSIPMSMRSFNPGRRRSRVVTQQRESQPEKTEHHDIAIVGVSGRYPQARNLQEYWHNLREGKDCITEIPSERWDHSQYFDPEKNKPGKTYSKWGGFLDGVDRFDPLFFNIAPREAEIMDPQERLFLQCVFETLEDAGYTRAGLAGNVGVYVGVMYEEYQLYGAQETLQGRPMALAGSPSSIANRVSYFCNFHGPSLALDTMCSSSLTAIHLACQSLLRGECQAAIAGGVNVSVHPNKYLMLAQGGFASSKGRCESFGQGGDGYVPAEGVGALLLKPLAQAQADGDHIYGIIKGSAINHGGKTNGYSVPNPIAQAQVIKQALQEAGVDARTISYIEAHGTGTALGDPIEITGLSKGFETTTQERGYCAIGSAKSNIGHAESAAGIAGVTKVLLQLKYGQLAPSLHAEQLNPHIDFASTPFVVQRELGEWRRPILEHEGVSREYPRRAGISSFGAGGSNAHVIIEEYVAEECVAEEVWQGDESSVRQGPVMIVLSARQKEQLDERVQRLLKVLEEETWTEHDLERIAYTLQVGREAMEERLALVVNSLPELKEKLQAFVSKEKIDTEDVHRGQVKRNKEALAAFVADEDMGQTLAAWMSKRKYAKLLDLWVKGISIDWTMLYGKTKMLRVSLPGYPFAQERYWVPGGTHAGVSRTLPGASPISTPSEEMIEHRRMTLLQKQWEPATAQPTRSVMRSIAIVTVQETRELALRLAQQFSGSQVIDLHELATSQQEYDWQSYGGCIDLVGCSRSASDTLAWLPWLQRLVEYGRKDGLWLLGVTQGLEAYQQKAAVNLVGATRAELYRMLQSEYERISSRHIDVDPVSTNEELVQQIATEFLIDTMDIEICYRDGLRYRAYLAEYCQQENVQRQPLIFPEDHVLWITGGTRGLGSVCAQHFVEQYGVRRLVLSGREELPPRSQWNKHLQQDTPLVQKIRSIQALEERGVQVQVLACSLADEQALQQSLRAVKETMGPIGGVIHCAGLSDSENPAFFRKTLEGMQTVLQPKVSGLEHLYNCLKQEPLQFFILFSSVSAIIPTLAVGQSDYAMANAAMDYFATAHQHELPIVSLQWPSWQETGIGAVKTRAYQQTGLLSITNAEGLRLLDHVLSQQAGPVILPALVNPDIWHPEALLWREQPAPISVAAQHPAQREESWNADGLEIRMQAHLRQLLAQELKIEPERLEIDTPFQDYGVDSIFVAQLIQLIKRWLKEDIDPSILYEYDTLEKLTHWLTNTYAASAASALGSANSEPSRASSDNEPVAPVQRAKVAEQSSVSLSQSGQYNADIAVVGMSGRFPGGGGIDGYWKLLAEGRSAIRRVPAERWGYSNTFSAALLDDTTYFDPAFFLLPEEDARAMDPQALLLLEESLYLWYRAGYTHQEIKGRPVGVYIGARSNHQPDEGHLRQVRNPIVSVGQNYLAANISQFFDLRGPGVVIDTACSSALVGMDMAIHALRSGEIESAMVGGVNVLTSDAAHRMFQQRGILSDSPAFHVFDRRAGGLVLGEGVGMVLLKTVEQALKDGDYIYAVVKALGTNNNGRTAGPATPNLQAQKDIMQRVLTRSGKRPEEISYIEVNGSGSEVTDLLELKAIQSVYRASNSLPCGLGSVKPGIGHPLCAEGIASFIKVVLMLHQRQMVPFLSGQEPMQYYDIQASPFYFSRELTAWIDTPHIAAINCFADGGTNVHAILEAWEAPQTGTRHSETPPILQRHNIRQEEDSAVPIPLKSKKSYVAEAHSPVQRELQLSSNGQRPTVTSIWKRNIVEE